ncbi:MAG: Uma2 family endonuclease [Acidobacteriota bacterium]
MSVQIEKRYFSVADYYRMLDAGILSTDDRVELIEGDVLRMSPIGSRHAACVKRLNRLFSRQIGKNAIISVQAPVRLGDFSEPQPDIALLKPRQDFYQSPREDLCLQAGDESR